MSLPIRTVVEDIEAVCAYLSKKPTGATAAEARKVLDSKHLDGRKLSALKTRGLIEDNNGRMKVTPDGRSFAAGDHTIRARILTRVIRRIDPYRAIVERAHHRREESLSATDVAAHWHEHFSEEAADSDKILNDQAVCFFQIAAGAGLGEVVVGRHGMPTRFEFDPAAVQGFSANDENHDQVEEPYTKGFQEALHKDAAETEAIRPQASPAITKELGQGIFVAHGKNKKPLEQLKRVLDGFKIPYRVATEEPNLGRPIGGKVREVMESCVSKLATVMRTMSRDRRFLTAR